MHLLQAQQQGFDPMTIALLVGIFGVFYFFMIRPQQKKQKELKTLRDELKSGDQVITAGGLHGKVINVSEDTVTLEIARNTQIKIEKSSISSGPALEKEEKK